MLIQTKKGAGGPQVESKQGELPSGRNLGQNEGVQAIKSNQVNRVMTRRRQSIARQKAKRKEKCEQSNSTGTDARLPPKRAIDVKIHRSENG